MQGRQGTSHGGSEANTHVLPYLVSFTPENRLGSHLVAFKLILQLVQLLLEVLGAEERGREGGREGGNQAASCLQMHPVSH